MPFSADVTDNYKYWDNPEAVTVTLKRQADTVISVATARREPISRGITSFNGVDVAGNDLFWNVPDALLSGNSLKIGDQIKDSGNVVFSIRTAKQIGAGASISHWQCLCTQMR